MRNKPDKHIFCPACFRVLKYRAPLDFHKIHCRIWVKCSIIKRKERNKLAGLQQNRNYVAVALRRRKEYTIMPRTRQLKQDIRYYPKALMERLENIKSFPMTLLEADSGFGKSTALQYFFDTRNPEAFPLHQHEFQSETPAEAWKTFCGLIAKFDRESAERLAVIGMPGEDTMLEIAQTIHGISCERETFLLLDNFQLWELYRPCEFLQTLSDHGGKKLHIVVATHPYTKEERGGLMRSGLLYLLQEEAFAFSREDTDAYYREAGLPLTGIQLEEVIHLTGGWVMALYIEMDALVRTGKFEQGGMTALMQKTFWGGLSEAEKDFLLEVSIFPTFTLSQAQAFSGLTMEETENRLREKRFFIRYDRDHSCYTMHTQLKKMLEDKFALLPEKQQREIYLKGGELAEKAGDRMNTLRFYYHAGAWERLYAMPLTSYDIADTIDETTTPMILDIMEHTTHEMKVRYPKSLVPLAFTLFFLGQNEELLRQKDEIKSVIEECSVSEEEKDAMRGELELLLSFLEYNRIDAMSERHRRALELLGGPATLINSKSTWTFGSPSVLYMYWRESGKLNEELEQMDECMPYYYRLSRGHGTGAELIMRAEAHLHRGETDDAEILCHRAIFTADSKRQNSIAQCGVFTLARLALLHGDRELLEDSRATLRDRSYRNTEDLCRYTYDLANGYLSLLLGNPEAVAPWLAEGKIDDRRLVIMSQPFAHIIYGRVLLEKKEYKKLLGMGGYVMGISSIFPNLLPQLYMKIYMAQAYLVLGKPKEAKENLRDALAIALPDRMFLPFAENYEGIKKLLPDCCEQEARDEIAELFRTIEKGLAQIIGHGLTSRELDVIRLIKQGDSYTNIAKKLFMAETTVKWHMKNIFQKTGIKSRKQIENGNF